MPPCTQQTTLLCEYKSSGTFPKTSLFSLRVSTASYFMYLVMGLQLDIHVFSSRIVYHLNSQRVMFIVPLTITPMLPLHGHRGQWMLRSQRWGRQKGGCPFGNSPVPSHPFSLPLLPQDPQFQNAQIQEEISLTVGDAHTRGSAGDKGNL